MLTVPSVHPAARKTTSPAAMAVVVPTAASDDNAKKLRERGSPRRLRLA